MKMVTIAAICVGVSYHLFSCGVADKKAMFLEHEVNLYKGEAQILRDQIADMQYQFSSRRTYEDGLKDGLENSKNSEYVRGYHFGTQQFSQDQLTTSK